MPKIVGQEIELLGSHGMQAHRYGAMLDMVESGELNPARLVGNKISLEQAPDALMNMEIDGFVVNRLQGALLEEAFRLVGSGIVSATDLDKAISDGLGLRWSFMGPMKTIHLNAPEGVADYVKRYGDMYWGFDLHADTDNSWHCVTRETLAAELEAAIPIDDIPAAQADRDKKLMVLLKHKQQK